MSIRLRYLSIALTLLATATARPAVAQTFEVVGTRAAGMGGAFVAVADDASATYWNPAGLALGRVFSAVLDRKVVELAFRIPASRKQVGRHGKAPLRALGRRRLPEGQYQRT